MKKYLFIFLVSMLMVACSNDTDNSKSSSDQDMANIEEAVERTSETRAENSGHIFGQNKKQGKRLMRFSLVYAFACSYA